jgi:GTP-binding protein
MADLTISGEERIIAKGGRGGKGNQHFATPTRQVPTFAKSGDLGQELSVVLELKLLADVGLVGFPNVGKSTLLSIVSAARPKIADYHFTTLEPNLGVIDIGDGQSFVMADIPGLIEGAHEGIGLGHEFLKHIERTRLIIHVLDMSGSEGRDPYSDYLIINEELSKYNELLGIRPQIIAANKMDVTGAQLNLEMFKQQISDKDIEIFPISAATKDGVKDLVYKTWQKLKLIPEVPLYSNSNEEVVYQVKDDKAFTIHKNDEGKYEIEGNWIRKLVSSINFETFDSLQYFQRAIKKKGVIDELESMGINEGDTVKIYEIEFDYVR